MKKAKAARVPILENAFELNLPKLMRVAKATGSPKLVLDDGVVRTVAVLAETRLAVLLGGRQWVVEIVPIQCLQGRLRPLLKCPHAHEGNFQSLYFVNDVLACRHCHKLRYRSNLAGFAADRARIARNKLLLAMGGEPGTVEVPRQPYKWRSRHGRLAARLNTLSGAHFKDMRARLERQRES